MNIVFLGLSITSSWGNGHASTYRALVRALAARGHSILFLERDAKWYSENRDLPSPPYCTTRLYTTVKDLERRHAEDLKRADVVVVGSYVPEGIAVADVVHKFARRLTAFYDIDTPVTLARLDSGLDYLAPRQISKYDLYLSFTGGPILDRLERRYGAQRARPLYCSVDPDSYFPEPRTRRSYDLGYLGTYSDDRQPVLDALMLSVCRRWQSGRFVVAGPQYPKSIDWPDNVYRVMHLAPAKHRRFYNRLRFALNITRRDMVEAGFSPSVRLFEAAACGTPIISDNWRGLEAFFTPGEEILLTDSSDATMQYLRELPNSERRSIGRRGRERVLGAHTAAHRAAEFESYVREAGIRVPDAPSLSEAMSA